MNVAALDVHALNNAMDLGALVPDDRSAGTLRKALAQGLEVGAGLWADVFEEFKNDLTRE